MRKLLAWALGLPQFNWRLLDLDGHVLATGRVPFIPQASAQGAMCLCSLWPVVFTTRHTCTIKRFEIDLLPKQSFYQELEPEILAPTDSIVVDLHINLVEGVE